MKKYLTIALSVFALAACAGQNQITPAADLKSQIEQQKTIARTAKENAKVAVAASKASVKTQVESEKTNAKATADYYKDTAKEVKEIVTE